MKKLALFLLTLLLPAAPCMAIFGFGEKAEPVAQPELSLYQKSLNHISSHLPAYIAGGITIAAFTKFAGHKALEAFFARYFKLTKNNIEITNQRTVKKIQDEIMRLTGKPVDVMAHPAIRQSMGVVSLNGKFNILLPAKDATSLNAESSDIWWEKNALFIRHEAGHIYNGDTQYKAHRRLALNLATLGLTSPAFGLLALTTPSATAISIIWHSLPILYCYHRMNKKISPPYSRMQEEKADDFAIKHTSNVREFEHAINYFETYYRSGNYFTYTPSYADDYYPTHWSRADKIEKRPRSIASGTAKVARIPLAPIRLRSGRAGNPSSS